VNICTGEFDGFGCIGIETKIFLAEFGGRYGLLGGILYMSMGFKHIQVWVKIGKLDVHRKAGNNKTHMPFFDPPGLVDFQMGN
jgi:hypothetical protein